jgi:hypothetical protein
MYGTYGSCGNHENKFLFLAFGEAFLGVQQVQQRQPFIFDLGAARLEWERCG